jgi:hypothetical protein
MFAMSTLVIHADENLISELRQIAAEKLVTLEDIVLDALKKYLHEHPIPQKKYSFIGIGHSGKGDISEKVDETLNIAADRCEGWSLSK